MIHPLVYPKDKKFDFGLEKLKISGFNNLTKILSFNLYDFCITLNNQQKIEYIQYINEKYCAAKIMEISSEISRIIEANILDFSSQDYKPFGASTMTLMSDLKSDNLKQLGSPQVSCHLDKSHITTHTYPEIEDPLGLCSFRVDIDIATCGEIIPLRAVNHLFEAFECDVVFIDYAVRGFTRLKTGQKIYNDHKLNSLRDFIHPEVLSNYKICKEINLPEDNIWQTKLLISDKFGPERYLQEPQDVNFLSVKDKMKKLKIEMEEIFSLTHRGLDRYI